MKAFQLQLSQVPRFADYGVEQSTALTRDYTLRFTIEPDQDGDAPWDNSCGHGPVSEWTTRDKRAGEWLLSEDRRSKRYYDAQEAQRIAIRDGWDAEPYRQGTKRQQAARAVAADFEFLRAWCRNDWCYVGVIVAIDFRDSQIDSTAICGVESYRDYWRDMVLELAQPILDTDAIERTHTAQAKCIERRERKYWESRDVRTVRA